MKLDQLLLGQIPEAIYFALFMILVKNIKEKRILFIVLMILEYVLLKLAFPFNMWFQVTYTFMTYIILKILYKEKSQIIDIFTFSIGSIILILISAGVSILFNHNIILVVLSSRILMFTFLFIFRHKLNKIQNLYKLLWNRNDKPKRIKTTTFRAINTVVFNLLFFIINFGMLYALLFVK